MVGLGFTGFQEIMVVIGYIRLGDTAKNNVLFCFDVTEFDQDE